MSLLEDYYVDCKNFKNFFIKNCHGIKKYEAYKVWAQWMIRSLCKIKNNYHTIPTVQSVHDDVDIVNHLKEKGADCERIGDFCGKITDQLTYLYDKYNQLKIDHITNIDKITETNGSIIYETLYKNGRQCHIYRYGKIFVKFCNFTHERLIVTYKGDTRCIRFFMFEMGFNYYMLEGHSFQWCVPPKAFNVLKKHLSTETELFASPVNAMLPNYYSLFYIDKCFGAIDNFFNIEPRSIIEGTYEVNPPFIEYIFVESSKMVIDMLDHSQSENRDLLFVYIMPNWSDSGGYQLLSKSQYLIDEIILTEKTHFYHQSSKHMMISANFETHVLIIGTELSKHRWSRDVRDLFIENFTHY